MTARRRSLTIAVDERLVDPHIARLAGTGGARGRLAASRRPDRVAAARGPGARGSGLRCDAPRSPAAWPRPGRGLSLASRTAGAFLDWRCGALPGPRPPAGARPAPFTPPPGAGPVSTVAPAHRPPT